MSSELPFSEVSFLNLVNLSVRIRALNLYCTLDFKWYQRFVCNFLKESLGAESQVPVKESKHFGGFGRNFRDVFDSKSCYQ